MSKQKINRKRNNNKQLILIVVMIILIVITLGWFIWKKNDEKKTSDLESKKNRLVEVNKRIEALQNHKAEIERTQKLIFIETRIGLGIIIIILNVLFQHFFVPSYISNEVITGILNCNGLLILGYSFLAFVTYGTVENFTSTIKKKISLFLQRNHVESFIELNQLTIERDKLITEINLLEVTKSTPAASADTSNKSTFQNHLAIREFIENRALKLLKHENDRKYAKVGFPAENYSEYKINGRSFYSVKTNVFKAIFKDVLVEAVTAYPAKFGTGNAMDVIEAIYNIEPTFRLGEFKDFLRDEQFCWVIENRESEVRNEVLRIELFRKLETNDKEKMEFTGGIFHAFKHFSYKGINLSTGKDINDILNPDKIIELAINAFFIEERTATPKDNTFVSTIKLNDKHNLKFFFYFEKASNVYFITTIRIAGKSEL